MNSIFPFRPGIVGQPGESSDLLNVSGARGNAKSYEFRGGIREELSVALKGIVYSAVETSVASVAPYTTLGTIPAAIFLALITLLVMLYSDMGVLPAFRMVIDASFSRRCVALEITKTLLPT